MKKYGLKKLDILYPAKFLSDQALKMYLDWRTRYREKPDNSTNNKSSQNPQTSQASQES